jgi:DNA gyrase subunit A
METGQVKQINIDEEMRQSYLSYAMSVIVSRALPDVRDGLKPVQRRILYAMYDMGLRPNTPYKKSARVVGEVLGKYHPHGDQSVYDAMVRLAQDFSLRYPLVEGQGNFGSIDGDAAAAMRYTEARLSLMGQDMLTDIDKETVDFSPNFDDTLTEPSVLPAVISNLLVNGATGIAVGMATSIPPHNLREVIDALVFMLDQWERLDDITVSDLMAFIQGPDFPTGGIVYRYREGSESDALANAYATGRGRITVQARAHVEQMERNKSRLVITELPYQANKTNLLGRIADLHRDGRIEGLTDLRDESDRSGMRIVIETTRHVDAEDVLAELYKLTPMQSTFSISLLALVDGMPRVLSLKQALRYYLDHRLTIVQRRSQYDLNKARDRAHILEGLLRAIDRIDTVIQIIRQSQNTEEARQGLMKRLKLTEVQAQAILDMPLRRLVALEQSKLQEEFAEKKRLIDYLARLLSQPVLMRQTVKEELRAVQQQYGDVRRTLIVDSTKGTAVTASDLLPTESVWVMVGQAGTIARSVGPQPVEVLPKPAEPPLLMLPATTTDLLYLLAADGTGTAVPVYHLPQATALGQGLHWTDLTPLRREHHLAAAVAVPAGAEGYLFLASVGGLVKRVVLSDLPGVTGDLFTAINVPDDDALGWAIVTNGQDEVILATALGQAIRFAESDVRPMGLAATGVMGIKLAHEVDGVVSLNRATANGYLWSITDNGLAKATPLSEYPVQGRYGQGVINLRLPAGAAEVVTAVVCHPDERLLITTAFGVTAQFSLAETVVGARGIKPRPLFAIGERNRIIGVLPLPAMNNMAAADKAVPKQLSFIGA